MKKILLTGFAFFGVSCIAMAQNEPAKAKKSTQKIVIVTPTTDAKPASAERVKAKMEKEKAATVATKPAVVNEAVENTPKKTSKN